MYHSRSGKALDGHYLGKDWSETFGNIISQHVKHDRPRTPPPSEPAEPSEPASHSEPAESSNAQTDPSSAWTITSEDMLTLHGELGLNPA